MPLTNVTIDDASALIQYHAVGDVPWVDTPPDDPLTGNYWDSTYHSSLIYRASATFVFDGIAVYVYGSRRSHHGAYAVYLDGQYAFNNNAYSADPQFKKLLYSATGLSPGTHNLTYINIGPTNKTYINLDYFTWTTSMESSLMESMGAEIPPSSSDMVYSSSVAWSQELGSEPTMVTTSDGASVTIAFSGNGIVLNGKTGLAFGMFSVQVDNNPPHQLSASSQKTHSTILFRQDNLSPGNHTLTVTNRGGGFTSLAIGSAIPIIWSADPNSPNSASSSSSAHSTGAGVIAGVVVAVVVILAALALFAMWFTRRRRNRRDERAERDEAVQHPQAAFVQATPFLLPHSPHSPTRSYDSRKPETYSQYGPMPVAHWPSSPGLTSPGLSSHGSFDLGHRSVTAGTETFTAGASSSGRGGPGSEAGQSAMVGKLGRYQGSTGRTEFDEDSARDRDAGPVMMPQLPPAYSDSNPVLPVPTQGGSTSFMSQAPSRPVATPDPSVHNGLPENRTRKT